ncbi:MAG: 2-C-methyl-D-erythritol 4-phosphate cytidylyltransferase [Candidatus Cloacimonetes bacterium]|nr:2-C-methyl-D-erythritol 4-phosphate cytidylyltransferase [Candidatus Cloacimonadota bacterium]
MSEKNIAIITAGGSGNRMKHKLKKQFIEIEQRPLLFWTLDRFADHLELDEVIVTLPEDEFKIYSKLIENEYPQAVITIIPGGNERQDSVYRALKNCSPNTSYVLIHDGVRPFISSNDISRLLDNAAKYKAVIPVSKVKNTLKKIKDNKIVKTVPRNDLVNALTPQAFEFDLILSCHKKAKAKELYFTDDAAIVEHFGFDVHIMEIEPYNIKITDEHDLEIAEMIIKNKQLGDY